MKIPLQPVPAPPDEYDKEYFANFNRRLMTALKKVDYAPQYDPTNQRTSASNPAKVLYSTGNIALDEEYTPVGNNALVPKGYVDALIAAQAIINTALATAISTAAGVEDTATGEIGVLLTDYDGVLGTLEEVLADIDTRLTAGGL